ncbi:hypothetical protein HAX54_004285, partial [Datura stramonium]|nr:hypothetical protein [Datura stramonium]
MVRDLMEHQIWWQVRNGNSSFWYDNWTSLGALINNTTEGVHEEIEEHTTIWKLTTTLYPKIDIIPYNVVEMLTVIDNV